MKKYLSLFLVIVMICSLLVGCISIEIEKETDPTEAPTTETNPTSPSGTAQPTEPNIEKPTIDTANSSKMDFDTYILDSAYAKTGENTMFSPLSLDMAFGMVAEGAGSEYHTLFTKLLGRENYSEFANQYMGYLEDLNANVDTSWNKYKTVFEIANSVWVDQKYMPIESFEKKLKDFSAEMNILDFQDISGTVLKINTWCNDKTHEMIKEIVSEDNFNASTSAVVINAVYFESPWAEKWNVSEHDNNFKLFNGSQKETKMIDTTTSMYYENEYATAFGCQYRNGLTFIGILPKEEGEFSLKELDITSLLESENYKYDVLAKMPTFKFDNKIDNLVESLRNAGYGILFDDNMGIFTQMLKDKEGNTELTISDIIQADAIELDENGTKAAAVTAIMMDTSGVVMPKETKEVILNRPFAFLIYDSKMNQIVFMGKVVNP